MSSYSNVGLFPELHLEMKSIWLTKAEVRILEAYGITLLSTTSSIKVRKENNLKLFLAMQISHIQGLS